MISFSATKTLRIPFIAKYDYNPFFKVFTISIKKRIINDINL